jgi:putative (di)nucleoside polyphosphate hydrolase
MLLGKDLAVCSMLLGMASQFFRANVGVVVARSDGHVLVFERLDKPGQWQLPQGGLDVGEEPHEAALRELQEETGIATAHVELLAEHPEWLAYELPPERRRHKTGRGQVQKWFLFRFHGADSDIDLEPPPGQRQEFRDFRWVRLDDLIEEVWEVRCPIYQALIEEWSEQLAAG